MSYELTPDIRIGLAVFYALVALMNFGFAWLYRGGRDPVRSAVVWTLVGGVFLLLAVLYAMPFPGRFLILSKSVREGIDYLAGPVIYTTLSVVGFALLLIYRKFIVRPEVGFAILNLSLLLAGLAMTDKEFKKILLKPDNVPIPILIYSVGFFTWLALYLAVNNDERLARGEPVLEKEDDEKVLVWPDLVYTELLAMILAVVALVVWAILLKAPLEQPATSAKAPNPSKAPWYFLGLQEMLVYFDPWMAGVVLPTMIIVGLIATPYIDFNREGNGYYCFNARWFAITTFMFGFLVLWVTLIVLGTILRGPNWNFFPPFTYWDPHKVDPLNNINVSQIFWLKLLGIPLEGMNPVIRELPGLILIALYLFAVPPLLALTVFHKFFVKMGFVRYIVLMNLLLFMASLPIKMVLRWTMNLKYIVYIPEIFFNI